MSGVRVIIVMGVSGAGKTTVGSALAASLGWPFYEGDDFHSAHNIALMASGHPLTDADRAPWLAALQTLIKGIIARGEQGVIACSALRHAYRSELVAAGDAETIRFVHLDVPEDVLRQRLVGRTGHFMTATLLESQLATLEESSTALRVDGTLPVPAIVDEVERNFGLSPRGRADSRGLASSRDVP
jgi:gluconokinase